ncbi:hypothetical protein GS535_04675, partial [Saccharibacter sp. EH611]|uniref:hypothetical protein n=3 Tax=unclassified Saccharibacter TaxID=2648722 RepID=UPI00132B3393
MANPQWPSFPGVPNMTTDADGRPQPQDLIPGKQLGTPLDAAFIGRIIRALCDLRDAIDDDEGNKVNRSGDTMSGDLTISGAASWANTLFGGKCVSVVAGQKSNSYLQTQIVNGNTVAVIGVQDNDGAWHNWSFNAVDGTATTPSGKILATTDAIATETQRAENAEAALLPLSGGTITGALYSGGMFQQGDLELTQPIGAALADEQFFLQLVNDTKSSTTWGRLVLRDGSGNFHVPIQVDNHDKTTINGTLNVTGQAGFQSSVLSQGTFQQGDLQMTMPIGAGFWDMQFFLQLANNAKTSTTYGRLVLKDNGGNYFVALQIDNHGHVTDAQGRDFLTKPEAQAAYLPLSGGNLTGALYSTGTFQQGSLELTQPVGAALADEQFFLQLVNETKNGTTWGRLVLRDGGGNFHVPIQVDNHDNTTVNGTLNVTGQAGFQSSVLSQGTFQQGDLQMTMPIGAGFWDMQFFLQLANNAKTGTTTGRLVLKDNGGNYFVALQIDNHGHVTDAQGRDFLTKPEAQAAYLPLSGGNLTGALYSTGTFQQGSLELTQPVGAALADEQFFLQLVNETKNGTTWGRLVLRDGGGNFHVPIQVDNHDNTTVNGTLNVTGQAGFQSSVLSQGTFQQGDLQMTMPIGAGFWDMQFFLQLANNAKTGTTTGRLVLKDNGGNYFVALQIDNHGHVTDAQGRDFLTKPEAQAAYLPLSGGNLTGALYSTGTFQQGSLELTQPVGAALADEQFFLQLVNETKNGTTWGRLVLRDGGGNFHVPIQVDNHDNTTVNGTLNVTGQAGFQSSVLSQGTFQQGDLQMTMPIGAGFWDMQFFLQLANNAKTGTTTGRLVLKDNGGNYFVALQIDNHGHVTDAQGRDFLTKPEAQAAYLPLSG